MRAQPRHGGPHAALALANHRHGLVVLALLQVGVLQPLVVMATAPGRLRLRREFAVTDCDPGDVGGLLNGQIGGAPDDLSGTRRTVRTKDFLALQEAFVELHLGDLSDNYDFIASRLGIQSFNSDFRGFIFNDVNSGARLFGNIDNNLYQYNFMVLDMRETLLVGLAGALILKRTFSCAIIWAVRPGLAIAAPNPPPRGKKPVVPIF